MENGKMSFEQTAQEDLKAFERRLTEVISCLHPTTYRWRLLLISLMVCISGSAYWWLYDPKTVELNFFQSICNHPIFALSSITLIILLILGIHKRVIATTIIAQRARCVLTDFNMSCDDTGKLILRPRPTHENKMLY